ncbi:hypothetical protein AAG906_019982 [Vitis piasezkii]
MMQPLRVTCDLHHKFGECPTIPTVRDMCGYQSSYTSSWNNHPNLTTQPQPQPSMSTSSLEQPILKISKVMEDFVEKVQDSIEKLTNLDIARGKRKLPPQPHHNLQGTNAKISRKVLKIDTLVGDCYDNSMDQPSIENHKHPLLQGREEKRIPLDQMGRMPVLFGIQGEFSMTWVCE